MLNALSLFMLRYICGSQPSRQEPSSLYPSTTRENALRSRVPQESERGCGKAMGFCTTNHPETQWLKTTVMHFIHKWARLSRRGHCLCCLNWEGALGLEDALLRLCTHVAGRLAGSAARAVGRGWGRLHVGRSPGCLGFLAPWRLGSKNECREASEIRSRHFRCPLW